MLEIENQGQKITRTNYWDSEMARRGYLYLTWNGGAGRLLVPDGATGYLKEMKTAKYVIVSLGQWVEHKREALELLFEDGSDSPFCLHLVTDQTDRLIPDTDQGGGFWITVWTRRGQQLRLPGKYRVVATLPCLEPWKQM